MCLNSDGESESPFKSLLKPLLELLVCCVVRYEAFSMTVPIVARFKVHSTQASRMFINNDELGFIRNLGA